MATEPFVKTKAPYNLKTMASNTEHRDASNLHSESSSCVAVDDDYVLDVVRFVVLVSVPLHELHRVLVAKPPSQAETEESRLELVKEGLQPSQVPTREIRQHQEQRRLVALVDSSQGCACGFRSTRDHGGRGPSGLKRRLKFLDLSFCRGARKAQPSDPRDLGTWPRSVRPRWVTALPRQRCPL